MDLNVGYNRDSGLEIGPDTKPNGMSIPRTAFAEAFSRAGVKGIDAGGRVMLEDKPDEGKMALREQALSMPGPEIKEVSLHQLMQIRQALSDPETCPMPAGIPDEREQIGNMIAGERQHRLEERAGSFLTYANDAAANKLKPHALRRLAKAYVSHFSDPHAASSTIQNEVAFRLSDFEGDSVMSANDTLRACASLLNARMREYPDFAGLEPLKITIYELKRRSEYPTARVKIELDFDAVDRDRAAYTSGRAGHQPDGAGRRRVE